MISSTTSTVTRSAAPTTRQADATISSQAVTQDNTNDEADWDADDVVWSNATFTTAARYGVIYRDTGTPSTSPVIAYIDFQSDQSPSASDFTVEIHADGIASLS